jgi:hypothetical protein
VNPAQNLTGAPDLPPTSRLGEYQNSSIFFNHLRFSSTIYPTFNLRSFLIRKYVGKAVDNDQSPELTPQQQLQNSLY